VEPSPRVSDLFTKLTFEAVTPVLREQPTCLDFVKWNIVPDVLTEFSN